MRPARTARGDRARGRGPGAARRRRRQRTFDHPERSDRGRIITEAFAIRLETGGAGWLPGMCARGGDDAKGALWIPLDECEGQAERFFEDHLAILEAFRDRMDA